MKRNLFSIFVVIAFSLLILLPVRGDILFIDMNNSESEVAAAWKAAEQRGEKLYVIPTVSDEVNQQLSESRSSLHKATVAKTRACGGRGDASSCETATAAYSRSLAADDAVLKSIPKLDNNQLNNQLARFNKEHVSLSSLIISGHHTDKEYFGVTAALDQKGIEKAFSRNKPLGDGIRSVYAWGCYAATTDDFLKNWKEGFPNTTMLAGFSGEAPSSSRPASGALLEDLLEKEKAFNEARDRDEIKGLFDSLADVRGVKAQICMNHETVVSNAGVRTLNDDVDACGHRSKEEQKMTDRFNCYLNADDGCEDPPKDTDAETNPLRGVYNYFQETRHCDEVLDQKGTPREVNQTRVRRLLFDKQILASFARLTAPELAKMNSLIEELGLPKELRFDNIWGLSRKDYLAKKSALEKAVALRMDALRDERGRVLEPKILAMDKYLGAIDKVERGECVSLEWIEMDPVLHDSKCGIKSAMQNAEAEAQSEVATAAGMPAPQPAQRSSAPYYQPAPASQE